MRIDLLPLVFCLLVLGALQKDAGVLGFRDSEKTVYFSRSYYKPMQEKLKEMRS